ncbi:MAG: hypothetical protein LBS09_09660 [Bacteroidales bacterium]|jgi:hypothetical protein|nr:hypothetical protein [Bacteroidales bacterium]
MKDITITVQQQKKELKYLIVSFLLAEAINLTTILCYRTEFKELYTKILTVLVVTVVIYFFILLVRFVVRRLILKK